jgi:cytochrome c oxidase cbb3-type subunit 3
MTDIDFTSNFWSLFIIVLTTLSIVWLLYFIYTYANFKQAKGADVKTMGHVWDGDLEEYNNPLPSWWVNMFYLAIFFAIGYLILYPGMGTFPGLLGTGQLHEYQAELDYAQSRYEPLFARYLKDDLAQVAQDPQALKMGERLYATYCTACHGSDAGGARGYPNLHDADSLYGNDPKIIEASILDGRSGIMPEWKAALGGDAGVQDMVQYVLSLANRQFDPVAAERAKPQFAAMCSACHGADGRGTQAMGAPNLTDKIWLYGGAPTHIGQSIAAGRQGKMPAHREFLGEAKVHLLAAYIYHLATQPDQ